MVAAVSLPACMTRHTRRGLHSQLLQQLSKKSNALLCRAQFFIAAVTAFSPQQQAHNQNVLAPACCFWVDWL